MTVLMELREKLREVYAKYGVYIQPLLKFLLAILTFVSINECTGYMKPLTNIFILLILALLSAILPLGAIVLFGGIMIVVHCFALGIEVGAAALIMIALMYLLYFRFVPGDGLALILTPAACTFGMPCAVPLGLGLLRGPASALSGCMGIFLYYFLKTVKTVIEPLKASGETDLLKSFEKLTEELMGNRELIIILVGCAAVTICTSVVSKLSADYAWYLAIGIGGLCYLVIAAGGAVLLKADLSIPLIIAGTLGAVVISLLLEFFFFHVDYKKSEYLQYQDDEYVYYVKAVPRIAGTEARGQERMAKQLDREREAASEGEAVPEEKEPDFSHIDFEAKLEETLKDFSRLPEEGEGGQQEKGQDSQEKIKPYCPKKNTKD